MTSVSGLEGLVPTVRPTDLRVGRRVHVVGIGGAGMRAIARVLLAMGHEVSGSDRADSEHVARLRALGATVHVGHDSQHVGRAELVTRSTAVPDENPEVAEALRRDLPVLARAEMLAAISASQPSILVAGTHGKTTTSSMLASILEEADRSPSFIIGSDVARFGTGARWQADAPMVIEADESDGTFLALRGEHAIVTSLDPDHLEFYGDRATLDAAFVRFVDGVAGTVAVCLDDADTAVLLGRPSIVTYGSAAEADLRIDDLVVARRASTCRLVHRGDDLGVFTVGLPGRHNVLNAAGAAAIALAMGASPDAVRAGLAAFGGVARRFEQRGSAVGVDFIDDYAHLPAEVEAAIATARQGGWNRVIATYQPHRFSRTEALGHTFGGSFAGVDRLVLTGIYPSGEAPRDGVTGRIVFEAVRATAPTFDLVYCETLAEVEDELVSSVEPGDLCLTLGAGDLTTVPGRVMQRRWRDWATSLAAALPSSSVAVDASIGDRTTYRVGGDARVLIEVHDRDDLVRLVERTVADGIDVLVVGRGSNLLVADRGFDGVAVVLAGEFLRSEQNGTEVLAGAAVALPTLARQTAAAGLRGFEWAVGVPGTIGGAVVMNAGGHGSDIAANLVAAELLDPSSGAVTWVEAEALELGYRTSAVGDRVVLAARLRLAEGSSTEARDEVREIVGWRRAHQPGGQNAGSVFTNPAGDSAGRLIDVAGGKGLREGTAEVSTKHANFIQVDPDGSADDVFRLMRRIATLVENHSGVRLEPETRLVGFDPFRSIVTGRTSARGDS